MADKGNDNPIYTLGGLAILAVIGLFIWILLPDSWTDKIKYSVEYRVDMSQVVRDEPPSDCDFMTAPLGIKQCHYKKTVAAFNANDLLIDGDNAPRYSNDTKTQKPIVS